MTAATIKKPDFRRIDANAAKLSAALAEQVIDRNEDHALMAWPALDQLPEPVDELPAPFPFDALGPVLGNAAKAIAGYVQAPDALAGGSVLAATAVAAQAHANVQPPHGKPMPLSLFVATSAISGDRKSATDSAACAPIDELKKGQARKFAREQRAAKDDDGTPPMACSITVSKGTPEGLHDLLRNQSHVGLFSPEGAELLAGHGMQNERRAAGLAWMLKLWSAEALDDLTRGKGLSVLIGRRGSMHVMVQPIILQGLMSDPHAQGQGLIARCLIAAPKTLAGTRMFKKNAPLEEQSDVRRYFAALDRLLKSSPATRLDGDGHELQPRTITMSPEAEALWIEAYNDVEERQAPGRDLADVTPWAGKFGEHAARIAGNIAMANNTDATLIDFDTMLGAIEVAGFYLGEHLRLMGQSVVQQELQRLQALRGFMKSRAPRLPHATVLQLVPRSLRNLKAEGINPLLEELARRGYIQRAGDAWEVNPHA